VGVEGGAGDPTNIDATINSKNSCSK
jgi:hypothetical protein